MIQRRPVLTIIIALALVLGLAHFTGALTVRIVLPGELWRVPSGLGVFIAFLLLSGLTVLAAAILRLILARRSRR